MRAKVRIHKPEEVEMTLELTATVSDWRMVHEQIANKGIDRVWPVNLLDGAIFDAINKALMLVESEDASGP